MKTLQTIYRNWYKKRSIEHIFDELDKITRSNYFICVIYLEFMQSPFFSMIGTSYRMHESFPELYEFILEKIVLTNGVCALGVDERDYIYRRQIMQEFLDIYPQFKPRNYDKGR